MEWTWDPRKAAANVVNHGIPFELALVVFDDPMHLSEPDPHPDGDRWRTIGMAGFATLFVVHTLAEADPEEGRIISARKATPNERKRYEEGYLS
jgi:uncharacterized DUF497 family protein